MFRILRMGAVGNIDVQDVQDWMSCGVAGVGDILGDD
jgi:2-keto-3-deoxy-6-phosphogluconate aldolase